MNTQNEKVKIAGQKRRITKEEAEVIMALPKKGKQKMVRGRFDMLPSR